MDDYAFDIVIFIIIKTINTTLIVSMILKKFLAHVRTECGPAPSSSSLIENLPWEANLHNIFAVHLPLPVFPLLAHFQEMVEDYHICIDQLLVRASIHKCTKHFRCLLRATLYQVVIVLMLLIQLLQY